MPEHPTGPGTRFRVSESTVSWLTGTATQAHPPFTVTIHLEEDWQRTDHQIWSRDGLELSLAVNEGPNQSMILITLSNRSGSTRNVKIPDLQLSGSAPLVWWMGSGLSYVAHLGPDLVQVLRPTGGDFFGQSKAAGQLTISSLRELSLAPGQEYLSIWRASTLTDPAQLRTALAPTWYPATPVVEQGQEIIINHPDGVVRAATLDAEVTFPDFILSAGRGLHQAEVLGADGERTLSLGWARELGELVDQALEAKDGLPDDLEAWFLVWRLNTTGHFTNQQLDLVDLKIAQALEHPSPFALAAAADATPFLGQGVLDEAITALLAISPAKLTKPGLALAGFRLYAQAAATDCAVTDRIAGLSQSLPPGLAKEIKLLTDPKQASRVARQLACELGFAAPGFVPTGCGYQYALLKIALTWEASRKDLPTLSRVLLESERWFRSQEIPPTELAWLLW